MAGKTKFDIIRESQSKTPEPWHFDAQKLLLWNEKEIYTDSEPINEAGAFYRLQLGYKAERIGSGWSAKETGRQIPTAHISRYTPTDTSADMCAVVWIIDKTMDDPQPRRNFKKLLELAAMIDPAQIFAEAAAKDTGATSNYLGQALAEEEETAAEEEPAEAPEEITADETTAEEIPAEDQEETTTDNNIFIGQSFEDHAGTVYTITSIDNMCVKFNGGDKMLIDFGTSRTTAAVLSSFGYGAKVITTAEATQSPTEDENTAPEEVHEDENTTTTDKATEAQEEPQRATEETTTDEPQQDDTTPDEPQTVPGASYDTFAALAAAYISGDTVKAPATPKAPEEKTPDQPHTIERAQIVRDCNNYNVILTAEETSFIGGILYTVTITNEAGETVKQDTAASTAEARRLFWESCEIWQPVKESPGYTGTTSELLTLEEITALENGQQVRKTIENHNMIYIATPYTDKTRLVYSQSVYKWRDDPDHDPLTPGNDFNYHGFINDHKIYNNITMLRRSLYNDIEREIKKIIPDLQTAEQNAGDLEPYEQQRIDDLKGYSYTDTARRTYCNGEAPTLSLYDTRREYDTALLIRYIENPAKVVREAAEEYTKEKSFHILYEYTTFTKEAEAYRDIINDPDHEARTLKAIQDSITDEKNVIIELVNGQTYKVESRAVKQIPYNGYIDKWYIKGNSPAEDIKPAEITRIIHGHRILYAA